MQSLKTIEVLPESVVEKIAAGEVVERPAAVVKELVENSIDADATEIRIIIEDAGFSLIKIIDNGTGMSEQNLKRCLLRHATSKIRNADDLFSIGTLGFRGEALGSIGAVSRMKVASAIDNHGTGLQILSEGGSVSRELVPQPHSKGTTISVADLFYNVPARKKFMKSHRGEHLAIIRMLEQLVIPFPAIHFSLQIDAKTIFDLPATNVLIERIAGVGGLQFATSLIECRGERETMDMVIYVASPEQLQERPRFQSLYVNLRRINNESVQYAIKEAFSQFLGHNHRPAFFCFLSIDPSRVDVNVHPTKQQIKFDNEKDIFSSVFTVVKNGIASAMVHKDAFSPIEMSPIVREREYSGEGGTEYLKTLFERTAEPALPGEPKTDIHEITDAPASFLSTQEKGNDTLLTENQTILHFPANSSVEKVIDRSRDNTIQLSGDGQEKMWDLIPCYQIHAMFILAPIKNGILLIDQHAAHERILFEQAMEQTMGARTASQQLLFPIIVELTLVEKHIVESGSMYFEQFGFELADFGGNSVSVSAIPAFLKDGMVETTLRDMVKYLLDGNNSGLFNEPQKRFAAAFACGAAIKAGQKLNQEEMNTLLNNLFSSDNPYICPHGRPTLVRMSLDELSRRFLR